MLEKYPKESVEKKEARVRFGVAQYLGKDFIKDQAEGITPVEKKMEDTYVAIENFGDKPDQFFGAVYDGHGGDAASKIAAEKLHQYFLVTLDDEGPEEAFRRAFRLTDSTIESSANPESGSTAVALFRRGTKIWVAGAGDARAVLLSEDGPRALSKDHKVNDFDERQRITKAGGKLKRNELGKYYLTKEVGDSIASINLSRSLGDKNFGDLVSPEPDIKMFEIGTDRARLVIGSDGLWDYLTPDMAQELIVGVADPEEASRLLRDEVIRRTKGKYYVDNVTILVIDLNEQNGSA